MSELPIAKNISKTFKVNIDISQFNHVFFLTQSSADSSTSAHDIEQQTPSSLPSRSQPSQLIQWSYQTKNSKWNYLRFVEAIATAGDADASFEDENHQLEQDSAEQGGRHEQHLVDCGG